jgi:hypothetical protein
MPDYTDTFIWSDTTGLVTVNIHEVRDYYLTDDFKYSIDPIDGAYLLEGCCAADIRHLRPTSTDPLNLNIALSRSRYSEMRRI